MFTVFKEIGGEAGVKSGKTFPSLGCPDSVYEGLVLKCMAFERLDRPVFHAEPGRMSVENLIEEVMPSTKS